MPARRPTINQAIGIEPMPPPKRRVRVVYVRVEVGVADGIAEIAERYGQPLSRTWERAAERYLIDHFGRAETPGPSLP